MIPAVQGIIIKSIFLFGGTFYHCHHDIRKQLNYITTAYHSGNFRTSSNDIDDGYSSVLCLGIMTQHIPILLHVIQFYTTGHS